MLIGRFRRTPTYQTSSARTPERKFAPRPRRSVRTDTAGFTVEGGTQPTTKTGYAQPSGLGPGLGSSRLSDDTATGLPLGGHPDRGNLSDFIDLARRMSIPTDVAVRQFVDLSVRQSTTREHRRYGAPTASKMSPRDASNLQSQPIHY
jgi:hypothetical protein